MPIYSVFVDYHTDVRSRSRSQEDAYPFSGYASDEELQFYDCEEGGQLLSKSNHSSRHNRSVGNALDSTAGGALSFFKAVDSSSNMLLTGRAAGAGPAQTPPELHELYGHHGHAGTSTQQQFTGTMAIPPSAGGGVPGVEQGSARDMAVNIVETLFVLAEFSFWKVRQ